MKPKLLTIKNYFDWFSFQDPGTGFGIDTEADTGENYLWVQTFLPKDFFNLEDSIQLCNPLFRHQILNIPDQIQVKLELIAIGSLNDIEAFIFKPWVVNVDNPMLFKPFESFHLFVPSTLFYNFILRLVFIEQLNPNDFKFIRILQDIPSKTLQRFGLDRPNVPEIIESGKLKISRLNEIDRYEILKFYSENWEGIPSSLEEKYFRPILNTWFRISTEKQNNTWFGQKKSTMRETVGFLRLYNSNSSFTGGTSFEYIIDKTNRNKGYATQATLAIIDYLKKFSYAISLGAEVHENNEFSIKILKNLGFMENKPIPFNRDNFTLSLFDKLKLLEKTFESGEIEISILNKYLNKFSRYFY